MLFSSPIFIFLFLPVFLLVYFILPKKIRNFFLLIASLIFYSWGEGKLIAIMLTSSMIDYVAGLGIAHGWRGKINKLPEGGSRTRAQKMFLVLSLSGNLILLAFFKYFNFGIDNFNAVMNALGVHSALFKDAHIILPLGISFYTFQSMSYTIDVYRGWATATRSVVNFIAFVTMFPQLVAGPIVRYADVAEQLIYRVISKDRFVYGIKRFIIGLSKKVLIANVCAAPADAIFSLPVGQLGFFASWLGVICYSLQIYFDFSGYSDMAIGMGHMIGFKFLENFNYPYIARSIKDFWRRWHISMSTWFRDYLYIPLGGNRISTGRTYFNLVVVFFITGLWHGASWNFVIWGLYHGLFLILERLGFGKILEKVWRPLNHFYVLIVVMVGWVFFRANDLGQAGAYLGSMFGFGNHASGWSTVSQYASSLTVLIIIIGIIGSTRLVPWLHAKVHNLLSAKDSILANTSMFLYYGFSFVSLVALFIASAMQLAGDTYNPFIYFRF